MNQQQITGYLDSLIHIAPLIDIPMFNIKYLATHKVQVHAGAISKLINVWFVRIYER